MKAMICPQCGASLTLDSSREFCFCSYCGAKIQINETVIHKHSGKVGIEGIATADSIAQKGFMDLVQGNYEKASKVFEKAQEIDPTNTYVLFGLACADLDPKRFFVKQLVKKHSEISEQEKAVINSSNALFFLKIYLYYDLPLRFKYVINNYRLSVTLDLLEFNHKKGTDYLLNILKPNRKIDIVDLFLKNNIDVNDIGKALIKKALTGQLDPHFPHSVVLSEDIFSTETFDKLLDKGLSPDTIIKNGIYEDTLKFVVTFVKNNKHYEEVLYKYYPPKKKGCYVATAVYGSYDCSQVWTLRRYRDNTLAETWYGRIFIKTYYAISPTLVKWFGNTNWFKNMCKGRLDRIVSALNAIGVEDTPYEDKEW